MTATNAPTTVPTLHWLTLLGYQINGWLRHGDHGLSFADVYDGLEAGTLWATLETRTSDVGFNGLFFLSEMQHERDAVLGVLRYVAGYLRGSERSRMGITSGGLALLMGLTLEAIQQQHWKPSDY